MRVNYARALEDSDYSQVRTICESSKGWTEVYSKKEVHVWTQSTPSSNFQMIKASAKFSDVSAEVVFDVLQDASYRHKWDKYMAAQKVVGMINPITELSYYAVYSVPPIRPRDFLMQRSWLDLGDEKLICSHSVCHEDYPPSKTYVRGTVVLSAYLIRALKDGGCHITYISHSDPKGKLPTWLVNRISKVVAPKLIKKLHKASLAYPAWKKDHQPQWAPWRRPEQQMDLPRVDLSKCQPKEYDQEILDESSVKSSAVAEEDDD